MTPWCSRAWWCLDVMAGRQQSGQEEFGISPELCRTAGSMEAESKPWHSWGCRGQVQWGRRQTTELWGVQSSLGISAVGKAAGAQERAVGGSQVGAPSQQQAEREGEHQQPSCLAPGLPTQRCAHALASPHQWPALQSHHSPSPQDVRQGLEAMPQEGRAVCSAPALLPTTLSLPRSPMSFPPWLTSFSASSPLLLAGLY